MIALSAIVVVFGAVLAGAVLCLAIYRACEVFGQATESLVESADCDETGGHR